MYRWGTTRKCFVASTPGPGWACFLLILLLTVRIALQAENGGTAKASAPPQRLKEAKELLDLQSNN